MADIIQYKCPNCGGYLEFNSSLQKLKCPFCDSVFSTQEFPEFSADSQPDDIHVSHPNESYAGPDSENFGIYHCESCGAEIIADESLASTTCPYCSNNIILTDRLAGELKPDYIIPFKYDKKAAKEALRKHFSGKSLLPKVFSSENHLDEVKGIYVPYWLYDAKAVAEGTYKMTKVRTWSDLNYNYTETNHYTAFRRGNVTFIKVPVDAARSIPNEITESLETFDYSGLSEFKTAYLSGYYANRYDVSSDECIKRAQERIKQSAESELRETVKGYSTVSPISGKTTLTDLSIKYALFPVWILNTTWRGKQYTFAMNGQTGKFVGDLPVDKWIYWKWRLLYSGLIGAALFGISVLLQNM